MIFERQKKARAADDETDAEGGGRPRTRPTPADGESEAEASPTAPRRRWLDRRPAIRDDGPTEPGDGLDDRRLDATEWRTDGPFDVTEARPTPTRTTTSRGSTSAA